MSGSLLQMIWLGGTIAGAVSFAATFSELPIGMLGRAALGGCVTGLVVPAVWFAVVRLRLRRMPTEDVRLRVRGLQPIDLPWLAWRELERRGEQLGRDDLAPLVRGLGAKDAVVQRIATYVLFNACPKVLGALGPANWERPTMLSAATEAVLRSLGRPHPSSSPSTRGGTSGPTGRQHHS